MSQWVLTALAPAALTLAWEAADRVEQERRDVDRLWQQRLERATYDAARAARHDRSVEPEPRLVARQLAKDWEAQLTAPQPRHEEYHRFMQEQRRVLSRAEREAIRALAHDLPARWQAPTTAMADRQAMLRQLLHRVIVAGAEGRERLQLTMEWIGGETTAGSTTRPLSRIAHLSSYPQLCDRIRTLAQAGCSTAQIAERLASEG